MLSKYMNRTERGFTLIELLVVIAIIAILAALILAALTSAQKGSRDSKRRSDVNQIKTAAVQYQADNNTYPAAVNVNLDAGNGAISPTFIGSGAYLAQAPANPGGSGAQTHYLYYGDSTSFCVSIQSERNTAQYIGASPTGQFNDKSAACSAANTY